MEMTSHHDIDQRSLRLHEAVARKIDAELKLLDLAREWASRYDHPAVVEWREILKQDWFTIRNTMLDPSDEGQRLRQSSPFAGILTSEERWTILQDPP